MIFVTVGTQPAPFDRLLLSLEELAEDEEVVAQSGTSRVRPAGVRCFDFMPFEDLVAHVRDARAVVAHAGVGSVLVAVANGKRPLVVPRRREFGEQPDDHQREFGRRLDIAGLVTLVEDPAELRRVLASAELEVPQARAEASRLVAELRSELAARIPGSVDFRDPGRFAATSGVRRGPRDGRTATP